ncbi:CDP-glucose 4,6-dehydratase [Paenibacillus athensensis]|uniref:CDP-glucose 4,6-dehydratase n=1 Tax=Paenibacillus athensensis TaxID=1967502 RepID=UPI001ADDD440|nr:CDP-glucose 4,6-dehydratase [Paenibacillus athensensis]MCD1259520.1 CDP-glucose 4,6-dehydratase [Paenibacillus athensensis]
MVDKFWNNKKVFVTGHTGFKGSWLSLWLLQKGALVTGYSLDIPTQPSMFEKCGLADRLESSIIGDVRDLSYLTASMQQAEPDIVFHMAAQPLVRESYRSPVETYTTNVMGTVNMLEAVKACSTIRAVINITTDKCYENQEWVWGYRENEALGGYDPYSSSKACSELVTSAYRNSFFHPDQYELHRVAVASARAGNVIGGGDWAQDRLIPDIIHSLVNRQPIIIRNPQAIRPWQHVLEPLSGYMKLAEKLYRDGAQFAEAWNFGPYDQDVEPVRWIVEALCEKWNGPHQGYTIVQDGNFHEAHYLKLDCSKAHSQLQWKPKWSLHQALDKIVEWTEADLKGESLFEVSVKQIMEYQQ